MLKGAIILIMKQKNAPILCWFSSQINFSVEKLNKHIVVKFVNCKIKNFNVFNFVGIYKRMEVFY